MKKGLWKRRAFAFLVAAAMVIPQGVYAADPVENDALESVITEEGKMHENGCTLALDHDGECVVKEQIDEICTCEKLCSEEKINNGCIFCGDNHQNCLGEAQNIQMESDVQNLESDIDTQIIYVSNDGGGDGSNENSTLTFQEAIHQINETPVTEDKEYKFVISLKDDIVYETDDSSEGFEHHHTTILGNGHSITTRRIRVLNEGTTLVLGKKDQSDNRLIVDAMVSVGSKATLEVYDGVRFENLDNSNAGMQQAITLSNEARGIMYGGTITDLHYEPQGVIQINNGSNFIMYDGEISNCSGGDLSYGFGGAIMMQDDNHGHSKLEIYGGTIKNNTAANGGAIFASDETEVYIKDAIFEGNEAIYGGTVLARVGSKVEINNTVFKDNVASYGGAVLILGNPKETKETTARFLNCDIYGNKALFDKTETEQSGGDGGALYLQDAKVTLNSCTITKNMAKNSGGGVYFTGSRPDYMLLNIGGVLQINDNDASIAKNTYLVNLTPPESPEEGDLTKEYQTFLTITDDLNDGNKKANIGVYMDKPGTFTAEYKTYCADIDPATYFFSDDINYHVEWTEDKTEARLVEGRAKYLIQAEAGIHGNITPEGEVMIEMGKNITFTIAPDSGYAIADVVVDGASVGAKESYTFENVTENHTIHAIFKEKEEIGNGSSSSGGSHTSNTYYVRYHNDDDTVKDGKFIPGETVTVKGNVFTAPVGKVLAGWSLDEDGKVDYKVGDTFRMPGSSVDLYAVWKDAETESHSAYISGYPDGTVGPDKTITRAEAATMFYNLLADKNGDAKAFTDVPANQWYAKAVMTLAGKGVISGYPDGTFKPNAPITRAEFVTMAMNFANAGKGTACSFPDVPQNMWYYGAIAGATQNGWISGYPDGTFGPDRYITRAEVTSVINRMENRAADMSFMMEHLKELRTFSDLSFGHWAYGSMMEAANGHDYTRADQNSYESWVDIH